MSAKRTAVWITAAGALLVVLSASAVHAKNKAFRDTRHGDRVLGPQRRSALERGSCGQCHQQHGSHDSSAGLPSRDGSALFAPNDNELCFACHLDQSRVALWPGSVRWSQSSHASSPLVVWPGPVPSPRNASDANKCVNCHDPHGNRDAQGVIPAALALRSDELCTRCHDGSRAPDVRADVRKLYRHPVDLRGRHEPYESSDSRRFGSAPDNRHAECGDCHNAHEAKADRVAPSAPDASARILAVSRVEVANGSPGMKPIYTWRGPDDTAFAKEYELCFKCHSGWTQQPVGQTDFGIVTNPANASYHPIQAAGKNRNIASAAFTSGWSWDRLTYCSDCHGSDDPTIRGPHGSSYRFILRKASTTSAAPQTMQANDLCFECHTYDVYANPDATVEMLRASRFNGPAVAGHAYHVGSQRIPCYACHETHGSVRNPALIATRRAQGMLSYSQSSSGGTCLAGCHPPRTYLVNYGR